MPRYRCVAARKAEGFAVTRACDAAEVSRSAFYDWLDRPAGPTQAEVDEADLINEIVDIHRASGGTYGQPRVTPELARRGWGANHKRVERLMADNAIVGHQPRKRRSLTKPDEGAPPLPTWSVGCSTLTSPITPGSATSPTSPPGRAGCTWPA